MEIFNFNEPVQRFGTDSYKWGDGTPRNTIPLWVADMDFKTAPCIIDALKERVEHGVFGYVQVPDLYFQSLVDWHRLRHNWDIDSRKVIYTTGVVPAVSAIIKALTNPGEGVILPVPAYNCFFSSIRNNKCRIVETELKNVSSDSTQIVYAFDFDHIEELASKKENKLFILCNPLNPGGRVWTEDELSVLSKICNKHGVTVVSDEIHCELTRSGVNYTPYATIDSNAIIAFSASKAFNIAGLQLANIYCPDMATRAKIDRAINDNEVCDVGPFGIAAAIAAYTKGAAWLDALRVYLDGNNQLVDSFFNQRFPMCPKAPLQATYLSWIDLRPLGVSSSRFVEEALKVGVRLADGESYGKSGFIRINFATSRNLLSRAMELLYKLPL